MPHPMAPFEYRKMSEKAILSVASCSIGKYVRVVCNTHAYYGTLREWNGSHVIISGGRLPGNEISFTVDEIERLDYV